jgi:hypothetical protein
MALAVSLVTAALPWVTSFQAPLDRLWFALTVPTSWLQRGLESLLRDTTYPYSSPYEYPWHRHFEFGGFPRAAWFHSLVAVPFWFVVFGLATLLYFRYQRSRGRLGQGRHASTVRA